VSNDDPESRLQRICRDVDEVMTVEDLERLVRSGQPVEHYIGFEISGRIHLGTGLMCMSKVRDFQAAGAHCRIFLADFHSWINEKLGSDLDTIRSVARGYFAEGLKSSLGALGADPDGVEIVLASELYEQRPDYWFTVLEVSRNTTLARMQRSISILGRAEGQSVDVAKLIYPAMQAADIFAMGVNLAHAGTEQRKAHVIARDVALQLSSNPLRDAEGRPAKPVAVHHPLIPSLKKPPVWPVPPDQVRDVLTSMKMSKSEPGSAIFIHDAPDEIRTKVRKAFCPPVEVDFNPVLEWARHLVFGVSRRPLEIARSDEHGGPMTLETYGELAEVYAADKLHPMDLKAAVADHLVDLLEPCRRRFAEDDAAEMLRVVESVAG
jgi:tyrosyl-tRNA synthetase